MTDAGAQGLSASVSVEVPLLIMTSALSVLSTVGHIHGSWLLGWMQMQQWAPKSSFGTL